MSRLFDCSRRKFRRPRIYRRSRDPHARVKDSQECVSDHPASFETPPSLSLSFPRGQGIYIGGEYPDFHYVIEITLSTFTPLLAAECRFSFRHSLFPTAGNLIPFTCREYRYIAGNERVDAFCLRERARPRFFFFFFFLSFFFASPPLLSREMLRKKVDVVFLSLFFHSGEQSGGVPRMRFVFHKVFWIVRDFFSINHFDNDRELKILVFSLKKFCV